MSQICVLQKICWCFAIKRNALLTLYHKYYSVHIAILQKLFSLIYGIRNGSRIVSVKYRDLGRHLTKPTCSSSLSVGVELAIFMKLY